MRVDGYKYIEVGSLQNDPRLDVIQGVILHVTGTQVSPLEYFDGPSNGIESHFYIPRTTDGRKEQYRDTNREADANYKANSWVDAEGVRHGYISVETQGLGSGSWTRYQLEEIRELLLTLHKEHNFPLRKPTGPKAKGVGYHILFGSWSNVPGKICPGPERIEQYEKELLPWMKDVMERESVKTYTVGENESAPKVADKFGLTILELWRMNPGVSLPLKEGQTVRIH